MLAPSPPRVFIHGVVTAERRVSAKSWAPGSHTHTNLPRQPHPVLFIRVTKTGPARRGKAPPSPNDKPPLGPTYLYRDLGPGSTPLFRFGGDGAAPVLSGF